VQTDSFDQIYQDYFDPVYRYVFSLSGHPNVAEEITQETFFKALRSLNRFRGDSSLKSWLCAIAKNIWISEQRKKKVQPIDDAASLADPAVGPEESILRQDESMHIHRLLHHLDEPYREVFTLRTLGQLCFRDIGELFGKSENWACVVYHRARAKIMKKMEELP
jgi:RNA polymerase sigma-70 factor (ECF subfamily)